MNVTRNVQLAHFFVERIPESVAQCWRFHSGTLTGIGIQEKADKSLLFHTSFEVRQNRFGAYDRSQRQAAYAPKSLREKLHRLSDDVVRLLSEPLHKLRVLTRHHLIGPRRNNLHICPGLFELFQMRRATEYR